MSDIFDQLAQGAAPQTSQSSQAAQPAQPTTPASPKGDIFDQVASSVSQSSTPSVPAQAPSVWSRVKDAVSSDPTIQAVIGAGEGAANVTQGTGPLKYAAGLIKNAFPGTDLIQDLADVPSEYRAYEAARSLGLLKCCTAKVERPHRKRTRRNRKLLESRRSRESPETTTGRILRRFVRAPCIGFPVVFRPLSQRNAEQLFQGLSKIGGGDKIKGAAERVLWAVQNAEIKSKRI